MSAETDATKVQMLSDVPCGASFRLATMPSPTLLCDMGCLCPKCKVILAVLLQDLPFPKPLPRVTNKKYLAWIRTLPCVLRDVPDAGACIRWYGKTEANHTGARALSRIADDDTALPFCKGHHAMWTDYKGYFGGIVNEARRAWASERVEIYRMRYVAPDRERGSLYP